MPIQRSAKEIIISRKRQASAGFKVLCFSAIFIIGLFAFPSLAAPAYGDTVYILRDELSCAILGANTVIDIEGFEIIGVHFTSWDSDTKTCYNTSRDGGFDFPDSYQNFDGRSGSTRYDTLMISEGVTLVTEANMSIERTAKLVNRGTLIMEPGGRSELRFNGDVENHGTMIARDDRTWGIDRSTFTNLGTVTNDGTFYTMGTTDNHGTFTNDGVIRTHGFGRGVFNNGSPTTDAGSLVNRGTFVLKPDGTFNNYAEIISTGTFEIGKDHTTFNFYKGNFDNSGGNIIKHGDPWTDIIFHAREISDHVELHNVGKISASGLEVLSGGELVIGSGTELSVLVPGMLSNSGNLFNMGAIRGNVVNSGNLWNVGSVYVSTFLSNPGSIDNGGFIYLDCNDRTGRDSLTGNMPSGNDPSFTPCAPEITSELLPPFFTVGPFWESAPPLSGPRSVEPFAPGIYTTDIPTITGTSDVASGGGDDLTITLYGDYLDDPDSEQVVLGTATTEPDGSWSITTTPLSYGTHSLRVTATNFQNHESWTADGGYIAITMLEIKDQATCDLVPGEHSWDSDTNTCSIDRLGCENCIAGRPDHVLQIPSGITVEVAVFGTRESNHGTINVDGTLVNRGAFVNEGTINNNGTFSTIGQRERQSFLSLFTGELINRGTIENYDGATLATEGFGFIINSGLVSNFGTINNQGSLDNTREGMICGTGAITNNPIQGAAPVEDCPAARASSGDFASSTLSKIPENLMMYAEQTGEQIHEQHLAENATVDSIYEADERYTLTLTGEGMPLSDDSTATSNSSMIEDAKVTLELATWKSDGTVLHMDVLGGSITVGEETLTINAGQAYFITDNQLMFAFAVITAEDGEPIGLLNISSLLAPDGVLPSAAPDLPLDVVDSSVKVGSDWSSDMSGQVALS